jgi:aquaporin related protein
VTQGLFIEVFLTAELVFVIIMLAAENHKSTHLAPVGIGIAFFVTQLTGKSDYLISPSSRPKL